MTQQFILNPTIKLILWLDFLLILPNFESYKLYILTTMIFIISFIIDKKQILRLLKRNRILFLLILITYILMSSLNWQSSIILALDQISRLICLLSSLSVLFFYNQNYLLESIYHLFYFFYKIGFNFDRFIVRLWLTLEYVKSDQNQQKDNTNFLNQLYDLLNPQRVVIEHQDNRSMDNTALNNTYNTNSENTEYQQTPKKRKKKKLGSNSSEDMDRATSGEDVSEESEQYYKDRGKDAPPDKLINLYQSSLYLRRKKFFDEHCEEHDLELAKFMYSSLEKAIVTLSITGVLWFLIHKFMG